MSTNDENGKTTPDAFGRHEVLDRAALLMDLVDRYLVEHQEIRQDEAALAEAARQNLFDLYQLVGMRHLSGEAELESGTKQASE